MLSGLLRCGKSCRLRWMNYLRPDIKRGNIEPDEDDLIIRLHALLGNRWSLIAGRLPGRTDNEIKNYWNTHLSKKLRSQGTDPNTHKKLTEPVHDPKRKKPVNIKNKKQSSNTNKIVQPTKPKVHFPKPVRITNLSLPVGDDVVQQGVPCYDDHEFLVDVVNGGGDSPDDGDLVVECQSLEKLYEEYLQILKNDDDDQVELNSFAESLLI